MTHQPTPETKGTFVGALESFVDARFKIVGAFLLLCYLAHDPALLPVSGRVGLLGLLLVVLAVASVANVVLWVRDYEARLKSGLTFLTQKKVTVADDQRLEQVRWSSAQILALVALILAVLASGKEIFAVPELHRVPVLTIALLILIALFDAALDLEAEWTMSILSGAATLSDNETDLAGAIWNVNQRRAPQHRLYAWFRTNNGSPDHVPFTCFSNLAQNLVSFAVVIVGGVLAVMAWMMWEQLRPLVVG